jgi:small-conductance mechanosensitive channel
MNIAVGRSLLIGGLLLIIGSSILSIGLGEGTKYLEYRKNPLVNFLPRIRRYLLPVGLSLLLLQQILELGDTQLTRRIIQFLVGLVAMITILSFVNAVLSAEQKRHRWQIRVPKLLFQLSRILVIATFVIYEVVAVWDININLIQVSVILGVGSLIIALALHDTLSNLVSGFLLIIEKPMKVGDWVIIGETKGQVIEMNWRSVRIRDLKNDIFIIPNSLIAKDKFINSTLETPYSEHSLFLTFSYNDPPNQVKEILQTAILSCEGVKSALVCAYEFKVYGIEYAIFYVMPNSVRVSKGRDVVLRRIYYAAKRNHLMMPYPFHRLYPVNSHPINQDTPEEIAQFLRSLSYLTNLDWAAFESLSHQTTVAYYGIGEKVVEIGQPDESLHIIWEGQVKLTIEDCHGHEQEVMQLSASDFFGEMALLSQSVSLVKVTVIEDLKTLVIARKTAQSLIENNPKLALVMNLFIEERNWAIRLAKQVSEESEKIQSLAG